MLSHSWTPPSPQGQRLWISVFVLYHINIHHFSLQMHSILHPQHIFQFPRQCNILSLIDIFIVIKLEMPTCTSLFYEHISFRSWCYIDCKVEFRQCVLYRDFDIFWSKNELLIYSIQIFLGVYIVWNLQHLLFDNYYIC